MLLLPVHVSEILDRALHDGREPRRQGLKEIIFISLFSIAAAGVMSCGSRKTRTHYDNTPMQYTAIFHGCKNDNFQLKIVIFTYFCYLLWERVRVRRF